MDNNKYALVTGASQGIGLNISKELAKRKHNLLMVSLPGEDLETKCNDIASEFNIKTDFLEIDLSLPEADLRVYEWAKSKEYRIDILVNNAGMGYQGGFETFDRDFYNTLINVNVVALVGITRLFLDDLMASDNARIMNVGSIASFFPMPYKIVYAASKGFVFSFSRALREELKSKNISVSVLCPGGVATNDGVRERIDKAGPIAKLSILTPEKVAAFAVKKMMTGRKVIAPGFSPKASYMMNRLIPTFLKQILIARQFKS